MPGRPIAQLFHEGTQRKGGLGGGIDDLRRNACLDAAGRQTVTLQLPQLPHEHPLGNVRQRPAKLVKTTGPREQAPQQQSLPPSAQQIEGGLDWTAARLDAIAMIER